MFTLRVNFLAAPLPRIPGNMVLFLFFGFAVSSTMATPFLDHVVRDRESIQSQFVKLSSRFAVNQAFIVRSCSRQFLDSNREDIENIALLVLLLSFSVHVQGRLHISASRSVRLSRVRLAKIWLNPRKSVHSKKIGSKHLPTSSHASQHRMSVPRCLFQKARHAVEAVNNLAPRLSGISSESSRTVRFPASSRIIFEVSECAK